jgi:hypothetical protein
MSSAYAFANIISLRNTSAEVLDEVLTRPYTPRMPQRTPATRQTTTRIRIQRIRLSGGPCVSIP